MNILKVKEQSGGNSLQVTFDNNSVVTCPKVNSNIEYKMVKEWLANGGVIEDEFTPEELEAQNLMEVQQQISLKKKEGKTYISLSGIEYSIPLTKEDADGLIQVYVGFTLGFITSTNLVCSNDVILPINSQEELMHLGGWFISQRNSFFVDLI